MNRINRNIFAKSVARRTMLAGVGAGLAGLLVKPLQVAEAAGSPTRLLVVHRPCGTVLENFFPATGDAHNFTLPSIISSFEPLKSQIGDFISQEAVHSREHVHFNRQVADLVDAAEERQRLGRLARPDA